MTPSNSVTGTLSNTISAPDEVGADTRSHPGEHAHGVHRDHGGAHRRAPSHARGAHEHYRGRAAVICVSSRSVASCSGSTVASLFVSRAETRRLRRVLRVEGRRRCSSPSRRCDVPRCIKKEDAKRCQVVNIRPFHEKKTRESTSLRIFAMLLEEGGGPPRPLRIGVMLFLGFERALISLRKKFISRGLSAK